MDIMRNKYCFLIGIFFLIFKFEILALHAQEEVSSQQDSLKQKTETVNNSLKKIDDDEKKNWVNLVDITKSWSKYQPATLDPVNWQPLGPKADRLNSLLSNDINLFKKIRLDPSIDSLLVVILTDSLNYTLFNIIGVKYGKIGYLNEAKEYFKKAIIIKPTFYKALNNMGNVYFKEGEFEKAYEQYRKSASLDETNADILINWAYSALELGKVEEAEALENHAFDLNQELKSNLSFRVITEIESGIAMKASEGIKSTLEPIWIE